MLGRQPALSHYKMDCSASQIQGACVGFQPNCGSVSIATSLIAVRSMRALPLALLRGHHRFMTLLVKLCDHMGKLRAFAGIHLVRLGYVNG